MSATQRELATYNDERVVRNDAVDPHNIDMGYRLHESHLRQNTGEKVDMRLSTSENLQSDGQLKQC